MSPDTQTGTELEDGRYVYCLVSLSETDQPEGGWSLEVDGIDGEQPRLIEGTDHNIGAVIHETDALYDSEDLATLREWLLAHHRVIEAATDRFGTPIPFQFDVILEGGDHAVRSVLEASANEIEETLASIADCREYRIELLREPDASVPDPDGTLAALEDRIEVATAGTAFLLEKKLERKRRERLHEQASTLTAALCDAIDGVVVDQTPSGGEHIGLGDDDERETISTLAVLSPFDREDELGACLDPLAENPDVAIRFTGPWAPYSFVSEITLEGH